MDNLFPFLPTQHDPRLVLLSLAIAVATGFVTFMVYPHLMTRSGRQRGWLLLAVLCAGSGIWTSHMIMALSVAAQALDYRPLLGGLSVAVAFLAAAGGIAIASLGGRGNAAMGGAATGAGLAAAHVIGLSGFIFASETEWDIATALLAAALGALPCAGAMVCFHERVARGPLPLAAALMSTGIAGALLMGMTAVAPNAGPGPASAERIDAALIALAIAGAQLLVLAVGCTAAVLESRARQHTFSRCDELIDALGEGVAIAVGGRIVSINARGLEIVGRRQSELIGAQVFGDLFAGQRRHGPPGGPLTFETSLLSARGNTIPVHVVRHWLHTLGQNSEVYAFRDLRERIEAAERIAFLSEELKQCRQDLRRRNFLLDSVLANMGQGVCMFDGEQRVILSNQRYAEIYGLMPPEIATGTHLRAIVQKRIDRGLFVGPSPKAYLEQHLAPIEIPGETMEQLNDGRHILVSQKPMPGGGWVTMHQDISDRRRIEAENRHLTDHDTLTGLPNRQLLRRMLDDMLAPAIRARRPLVVLILDLNHFRQINDTLGLPVGDALLKATAERLRACTRKTALLARFGDDEFVLVDQADQPVRDAAILAGRLQDQIRQPFKIGDRAITIDTTIGIAIAPSDGADSASLLKSADLALLRAKQEQRGTYRFFEPAMDRDLRDRQLLEQDLAVALSNREFVVYYQPLVNLARDEIAGFEALLRWHHPARGLLAPGAFLQVAETGGFMPAIEEWVLRQACEEAAGWPDPLKLSVNVSPGRFRSQDFVRSVINALAASGLNAQRLELEISEGVLNADPDQAAITLRQLTDIGVKIALDDFGSGFLSLDYLRRFPIQRVKVDRRFMGDLSRQEESRVILRTLSRLGSGFGVSTTAEGVETKEQVDLVRAEGFTEMQGYFISPPRGAEEIRGLFLRKPSSAVA